MELVFNTYISVTGSTGASVVLLSTTFSLVLWPFNGYCEAIEKGVSEKMALVGAAVADLDPALKGEPRFSATEQIYKQHDYHPISSVLLGIRFFLAIPILLSAIVLMSRSEKLVGQQFGFIGDLSQPDQLVSFSGWAVNIMPILMLGLTFVDAKVRYVDNNSARNRFYFISAVLFFLVYPLASGLILYWIGANLISFIFFLFHRARSNQVLP